MKIKNTLLLLIFAALFSSCGSDVTTSSNSSESEVHYQIPEHYTGDYKGTLNRASEQVVNDHFSIIDLQNNLTGEKYIEVFFSWCDLPESSDYLFISNFKFQESNLFRREQSSRSLTYFDRITGEVVLNLVKGEQSAEVFMDISKYIDAPCNFNGTMPYEAVHQY